MSEEAIVVAYQRCLNLRYGKEQCVATVARTYGVTEQAVRQAVAHLSLPRSK